jgi:uncharacterized protein
MLAMLRIILIVLVVRALWKLIKGVLEGAGYTRVGDASTPQGVTLFRDPVCGVYLPASRALIARTGGETLYFCSEKCRDAWGRR